MDANEMAQFVKNELDVGEELTSAPEEGSTQDFNKKVRMFSKDQLIAFIDELNKDLKKKKVMKKMILWLQE
jgi:hypothetical protein